MIPHFLLAATFFFFLSFGYTLFTLGAGRFRSGSFNPLAMSVGFVLLSLDLWQRGNAQSSCPINSLYDVLIFMSWAIVLIYLIVGSTYRLSLMGAFTSPLVFCILLVAQLAPIPREAVPRLVVEPLIEFHASVSLIAYGAFALAAVAGFMYLVQDRQLKQRKLGPLLLNLPPITELGVATGRLLILGFSLLTAGFLAGLISGMPVNTLKFGASAGIWAVYGCIVLLHCSRRLAPRRIAGLSLLVFSIVLCTLPVIQKLSALR